MIRLYFKSIEISVWIFYNCTYLLASHYHHKNINDMKSLRFHGNSFSHEFLFMAVFFISSNLVIMCQIHLWVPPKKMNSSSFKVINHISYHANHCPYFLSIIIVVQMQQPVNLSFPNQNKILGKHKTDNYNQL